MTIRQLKKSISEKSLGSLYLFYGDEDFLVKTYLDNVNLSALSSSFNEFNLFENNGNISLNEIISNIEQYPQGDDKIVVIAKNSGLIKAVNKSIQTFLENIPDYAIVIFVEATITQVSKVLLKTFNEKGNVVEFAKQKTGDLCKWGSQLLAKNGGNIEPPAMEYLVKICGNDMYRIYNEIEKLSAAFIDETIDIKRVKSLVHEPVEYKTYNLIDKLLDHDSWESYKMLNEFKINKEQPTVILANIFSQILLYVMVKELNKENTEPYDFFPANRRFLARKITSMADKYDIAKLNHVLELCADYDYDIKNGTIDGWTALEIVIATLLQSSQNSHQFV
jgi:DNA polymerase-3 subunit delta